MECNEGRFRLWHLTVRGLGLTKENRHQFTINVAMPGYPTEQEAVDFCKATIHSPEWWAGHLIQEVEQLGDIWAIQGVEKTKD